ncbi:SprB repeat-containing protein, partial [Candidatus Amoebophilus asiaticus]|nr:SprB repeat-containing protein [Candidatus Amoebophilus asiaticus]
MRWWKTYFVFLIGMLGYAQHSYSQCGGITWTVTTASTNNICYGDSAGIWTFEIDSSIIFTNPLAPFTFVYSTGQTVTNVPFDSTVILTDLVGGTYAVTQTDANGCQNVTSVTVGEPDSLLIIPTIDDVDCNGGNDGSVTTTVSGGTSPYSFSWSTGGTTNAISGLTAGNYTLTLVDAGPCTTVVSYTVNEPNPITLPTSTTDVLCNGGNTGTATVSPTGGTTPYTYSWSTTPTQTDSTATALSVGTYTVTVIDAAACTASTTVIVNEPPLITLTTSKTDVSCQGGSDGTAQVSASGGTTPYTYFWSTGATTTNISGLIAGVYTITVIDAGPCTSITTVTIIEPDTLGFVPSQTDPSCNGTSDGTASVSVFGGTSPYTYAWSTTPQQTDSIATALAAGTYTVTITDANGCDTITTITLIDPDTISFSTSKTDVACNGGNDGTATVSVFGGTPPYTYSWSTIPSQTDSTATSLSVGTYTVTITDANGCDTLTSITITEPDTLNSTTSKTDVDCNGGNDGTGTVSAFGGTPPYTYAWSTTPSQTGTTATGLSAGTYTVTITDALGCDTTTSVTIIEPDTIDFITSFTPPGCNGGADGTATVSAFGGTTPFTYSWSTTPSQSGPTATGLTVGIYTVTITDALGCDTTAIITVTEPDSLGFATDQTSPSCNGNNDGTATVSVFGGTPPYTYSWSTTPQQTDSIATALSAGTYTVTIVDANGCDTITSITILDPDTIGFTTDKTDVSCNGGNDATASVSVFGGSPPYTYSWSTTPQQTDSIATALSQGTYTVTITDANGCDTITSITITEPDTLSFATSKTDVSCNGGNDGTATVSAFGGTPPYTYVWNTIPSQTGTTATGLSVGTYTVTITDSLGCDTTTSVTITEPNTLDFTITFTPPSCNGGSDGTATVSAFGGTTPFTYSWNTIPS